MPGWLIALAIVQATPVPPPAAEDDIVVTARRVMEIGLTLHGGRANRRCEVDRPSGNPTLDALACERLLACVASGLRRRRALTACVAAGIPEMERRLAAMPR